ncbi:hypothetical protein LSTR_LSTR005604 [Laodelphax striatellus]|uniref:MH2 domain-containing protein n=1 Tax=Laodelphax striatellus TaxID=195883 RepID=A0A482WXM7_LAOST|nr:hypothetical protein LSTR_LSTR005604 [Laodelphax striatellus]
MSRRKSSTTDRGKTVVQCPQQNPSKPTPKVIDELQDASESSDSSSNHTNDSDFRPLEKRSKPSSRRPYVNVKKSKGRRLRRNLVKERKVHEEASNISTEIVAASSGENPNNQPKVESSNPPLEQSKPAESETETNSDYLANYLAYLQDDPLDENFSILPNEPLFSDIEDIVNKYLNNSHDNELQSIAESGNEQENYVSSLKFERGGKNMDLLSRGRDEIIQNLDAQNSSHLGFPVFGTDSDSERDSSKMVEEFFEAIGKNGDGEIFTPPSATDAVKSESTTQEPSNSNIKNPPAQNQEIITDEKENLNDLAAMPKCDENVGESSKTIEANSHEEISSTQGPSRTMKIQNPYPQNREPAGVREKNMNDVMTAPIFVYSGTENQEIIDLKTKFSNLEIVIPKIWKKLLGLEAAMKNHQILQNKTSLMQAEVLGSGGNLRNQRGPAQSRSASVPNQQSACSSITSRQKPPPKYEEHPSTSVSSAGNMRIEVVKSEKAMELEATATNRSSDAAKLKKQFDTALSVLVNIQNKMKRFSIGQNESQDSSMRTAVVADLQQPGPSDIDEIPDSPSPGQLLVTGEDYQSPVPLGIDKNRQMTSAGASMEVDVPVLQQPGPSGLNQIREASWVIYDEYQCPGPSGINRIRQVSSAISFDEPRVSNAGDKIWGELTYFEDSKQVGRNFPCKGLHVRVDCFKNREFNKRNNGYHVGPFRNSDRSRETTGIRNKIDCGIMLYFIRGQLSIVNHSKCTLYVLSNISIGKTKDKISKDKRQTCIPPDHTVQILRVPFNKQTNSIIDLTRTVDQFDESFYRVYISFDKNWTERGPNELPCWLALQLKPSGEE